MLYSQSKINNYNSHESLYQYFMGENETHLVRMLQEAERLCGKHTTLSGSYLGLYMGHV